MLRKLAAALDKRHEGNSLDRLAKAFNRQMQVYKSADAVSQISLATFARELRHIFAAAYPELEDFLGATHPDKSKYLSNLSGYVERLSKGERSGKYPKGASNGAVLVQFWITALAWGDFELADAMAERLEPLNRAAYEFACATSQANESS